MEHVQRRRRHAVQDRLERRHGQEVARRVDHDAPVRELRRGARDVRPRGVDDDLGAEAHGALGEGLEAPQRAGERRRAQRARAGRYHELEGLVVAVGGRRAVVGGADDDVFERQRLARDLVGPERFLVRDVARVAVQRASQPRRRRRGDEAEALDDLQGRRARGRRAVLRPEAADGGSRREWGVGGARPSREEEGSPREHHPSASGVLAARALAARGRGHAGSPREHHPSCSLS